MLGVYLDVCCLNRPFNDQTQDRIRLESAAVLSISTAVEAEIEKDSDLARKAEIRKLAALAKRIVAVEQKEAVRAIHLQTFGFGAFDALHIAHRVCGKRRSGCPSDGR